MHEPWNISHKHALRLLLFLALATILARCNSAVDVTPEQIQQTDDGPIIFSHEAGYYSAGFTLELESPREGTQIYYTLDGSLPNPDNTMTDDQWEAAPRNTRKRTLRYESPIPVYTRYEADLARIPTNQRDWDKPRDQDVARAVVVRVIAVAGEGIQTPVQTRSFFVDSDYTFPVVSITTDRENLFSHERGIYVAGENSVTGDAAWQDQGNYTMRGIEWERPAHFELFNTSGQRVVAQNIGLRLHGGASRSYRQKSFRLYSRSDYGESRFHYQFFPTKPIDDFNRIILRNSGNDLLHTMFRDAAVQGLIHHWDLATQHYQPAIVYVNGEYWGIKNFRDRYDRHYVETHYGVPRENVVILQVLPDDDPEWGKQYQDMVDKIYDGTLNSWKLVDEHMDVSGYLDYHILNWYGGNYDWPNNNVRYWRYTGTPLDRRGPFDGRWRWMVFDTDFAFAIYNNADVVNIHGSNQNMIEWILEPDKNDWWNYQLRKLMLGLMDIQQVRHEFLQRMAVHLATTFAPQRVVPHVEKMADRVEPEIGNHLHRWWPPPGNWHNLHRWQSEVDKMIQFGKDRPGIFRQQMMEYFDEIHAVVPFELRGLPQNSDLELHGVRIHRDTPGVQINRNVWSGNMFAGDAPVLLRSSQLDLRTQSNGGTVSIKGEYELIHDSEDALQLKLQGATIIELNQ